MEIKRRIAPSIVEDSGGDGNASKKRLPQFLHTQIPNFFLDNMSGYLGSEVKVFLAICRRTLGWHKLSDEISYTQLQEMTGLSVNGLKKAIRVLTDKNWIVQHSLILGGGRGHKYVYELKAEIAEEERYHTVTPLEQDQEKYHAVTPLESERYHGMTPLGLERYHGVTPQKKDLNKKNSNKTNLCPSSKSPFSQTEQGTSFVKKWKKKLKQQRHGAMAYPEEFETWWEVYPRKDNKKKAFSCWLDCLGAEDASFEILLTAARDYKRICGKKGTAENYIKLPSTFLGPEEPWRDHITGRGSPPGGKKSSRICPICDIELIGPRFTCPVCELPVKDFTNPEAVASYRKQLKDEEEEDDDGSPHAFASYEAMYAYEEKHPEDNG